MLSRLRDLSFFSIPCLRRVSYAFTEIELNSIPMTCERYNKDTLQYPRGR